ncbi:hypothetical protein K8R03_03200 [Candidatus Kaiserbacteria bacterium]|nr:hypothetical protein [Candidatus Kaiserbacteria bacterium]
MQQSTQHIQGGQSRTPQSGVTTLMVVGFMGVFMMILGMLTSYVFEQAKYGRALYGREQALHIAESGLEYYRWFLSHNPGNLTNGTGLAGPYTYTLNDPEGGALGTASLTVTGATQCGQLQWIDITSRGVSNLNPSYPRTLYARYMHPSVATFSYLLNSSVWAGADRNITGPYFSNGGIRMDGTNNSNVSSAVSTWYCDIDYNCDPTQSTAPGVLGSGSGSALWQYPVASVDFGAISANFANLKTYASSNGGLYFAKASGSVSSRGYHFIFNSDGTVTVKRVSATTAVPSYSDQDGWVLSEYSIIKTETLVGTYTIPASCSLIFVEDRAWVEGTVKGKVTLVAATPSDASTAPTIYIPNNITYATNDGTTGLTLMAEDSVLIPLNSPDTMTIRGIFVAQGGHFGRNFYIYDPDYGSYSVSSTWSSYVVQSQLTTQGSVVSNLRTGTSWDCGSGTCSGYQTRVDAYDQLQATSPPPFTPGSTTDYKFVLWREE